MPQVLGHVLLLQLGGQAPLGLGLLRSVGAVGGGEDVNLARRLFQPVTSVVLQPLSHGLWVLVGGDDWLQDQLRGSLRLAVRMIGTGSVGVGVSIGTATI